MRIDGLKQLPIRDSTNCFGCGPKNAAGLQMRFFTNEEALFSWLTVPRHFAGWRDIVHGGVITTILDEVMGWSAIYLLRSLTMTKAISVEFLKPVHVGQELRAEGRLVEKNGEREVRMEGLIFDSKDRLCSRGIGVFALFPPDIAKRRGLDDSILELFQSQR